MSKHGKRLVSGVRELLRTEGTTLEDLHMVATDVILTIDRAAAKIVRKLKKGQKLRCYDEASNKEYGQKGSDLECYFNESYETKTRGLSLKVYAKRKKKQKEWVLPVECLLQVYEEFDPESDEGVKRKEIAARPKKRGRKPKKSKSAQSEDWQYDEYSWSGAPIPEYEQETEDEEYDFESFPEGYDEYVEYD